jgi:hypothetical protein
VLAVHQKSVVDQYERRPDADRRRPLETNLYAVTDDELRQQKARGQVDERQCRQLKCDGELRVWRGPPPLWNSLDAESIELPIPAEDSGDYGFGPNRRFP